MARKDFTEVNAKTKSGWTALHFAVSHDTPLAVEAILGRREFTGVGANPRQPAPW